MTLVVPVYTFDCWPRLLPDILAEVECLTAGGERLNARASQYESWREARVKWCISVQFKLETSLG